jgi:hypothetical protein
MYIEDVAGDSLKAVPGSRRSNEAWHGRYCAQIVPELESRNRVPGIRCAGTFPLYRLGAW